MMMPKAFKGIFTFTALTLTLALVLSSPVEAESTTSTSLCTSLMLRSFTPCMNYLTGSTDSGTSPTADCCTSLKLLMSNGLDCLCLIVMGGVPFRIPLNQNLAISLPKACDQSGVPIECKASPAAPLPAPGPAALSPFASTPAADSPSPGMVPVDVTPALAPMSDITSDINPTTTMGSLAPTSSTTGSSSSSASPSAVVPSLSFSPSLLLLVIATIVVKYL